MKNPTAIARRFFLIGLYLLLFSCAQAANYYFSSTGDDNRSAQQAQNPATPWKSIEKLNAIFSSLDPGDSVLFKKGDAFYGSIIISRSGRPSAPIVLAAYGTGNRPVISGFSTPGAWASSGQNIWETTINSSAMINMVLINRRVQPIGRYPNKSAANGGYLSIESYSESSAITDMQLPSSPNWEGGEVVIRKNRWVLDRNQVLQHNGNTIRYGSESGYFASEHFGYFFQNHPGCLDMEGEWYYQLNEKKLGILMTGSPAQASIQVSTIDRLVIADRQNNIIFVNLSFEGANTSSFDISNAGEVTIDNCEVLYSGVNAINVSGSNGFQLVNTVIDHTNNIACNIENSSNTLIRNNKINHTGMTPGMGKGNSGSYEALLISGDENLVEFNHIDSTGYIPVTFSGNSVTIRNNFIDHFALVKDDGGGIYTWNNAPDAAANHDRSITGNIILNGYGAEAGTDDPGSGQAHGIYIDDNAGNVIISGNTIAHCAQYGIYLHNAHDIVLSRNTSFNNQKQLVLSHDHIAPNAPVRNVISRDNIWFSKQEAQVIADYKTTGNDLQAFGSFDSNYYCRPVNDEFVIYAAQQNGSVNDQSMLNLQGWKAVFQKDPASKKSPVTIPAYSIGSSTGLNQFSNGSFNNHVGGLYAYSAAGNCTATWSNAGQLDGGNLKITFTNPAGSANKASVIIGVGAVSAGKMHLLKFSTAGGEADSGIEVFLRKSLSPYNDLSQRKLAALSTSRKEYEFLLVPSVSEPNASLVFDVKEQSSPVYFDNISLVEVNGSLTDPDDFIRFEYNNTSLPKTVSLNGSYVDAKNILYANSITLYPYTSAVLMKRPESVALPVKFIAFTAEKKNSIVELKWTIGASTYSGAFLIERSGDGRQYTAIGSVDGNASTNGAYRFSDLKPLKGKNYYRIRQEEASGTSYSKVLVLFFSDISSLLHQGSFQVSPNPVSDRLYISLPQTITGVLLLQSSSGALLRAVPITGNEAAIDVSALSKGMYLLSVISKAGRSHQQFIKE